MACVFLHYLVGKLHTSHTANSTLEFGMKTLLNMIEVLFDFFVGVPTYMVFFIVSCTQTYTCLKSGHNEIYSTKSFLVWLNNFFAMKNNELCVHSCKYELLLGEVLLVEFMSQLQNHNMVLK